jgi:hypothetical protein
LANCKISSPNDIILGAKKYGDDYMQQIFTRYIQPTSMQEAVRIKAPTFHDCTNFFSEKATLYWLRFHIADTFAFLGIYDNSSVYQIRSTANLILRHEIYGQLTFPEFLVFLERFKIGQYGRIFNSSHPNPQEFLICLRPFWNDLSIERARQEECDRQKKEFQDAHSPDNITWEEYCTRHGIDKPSPLHNDKTQRHA